MKHDKGTKIGIQDMFTSLEKKYSNLVKSRKQTKPSGKSADAKYISLLVVNPSN